MASLFHTIQKYNLSMLQVITGKFFQTDDLNITLHRAVLYTNYRLFRLQKIETVVGNVYPTAITNDVMSLVYEVEERLEKKNQTGEESILVSTGGQALINDFSTVLSFALNVICDVDYSLVKRLTGKVESGRKAKPSPDQFVNRVFDTEIFFKEYDDTLLQNFLKELVGLERKSYQTVMRAIHRYVTALHRISDDIDLSYSLLVASIESLVQGFDLFEPTWDDFESRKRKKIDKALEGASNEVQQKVKQAIIDNEHVALSRRFRDFTIEHLAPSFFREESAELLRPIPKSELHVALNRAYQFRSKYVHTLKALPGILRFGSLSKSDYIIIENRPTLSINGLARIARHVLFQFVARAEKVSIETVNYRAELPNIIQAEAAPQYWVWKAEAFNVKTVNQFLGGFLSVVTGLYKNDSKNSIPMMDKVLEKIERIMPGLSKVEQRLPMLFMYWCWHYITASSLHRDGWSKFVNQFHTDFDKPSIESVLFHVLTNLALKWTLNESLNVRKKYLTQRHHKNGLRLGHLFEAIITLRLATDFQKQGNVDMVKELVSQAVVENPGYEPLVKLEILIYENPYAEIDGPLIMGMINSVESNEEQTQSKKTT